MLVWLLMQQIEVLNIINRSLIHKCDIVWYS